MSLYFEYLIRIKFNRWKLYGKNVSSYKKMATPPEDIVMALTRGPAAVTRSWPIDAGGSGRAVATPDQKPSSSANRPLLWI